MFKNLAEPFVIAEVGQNHQGDLDLAIEYIRVFAKEGADAVKFQTRNNKYLFSKEAYEKKYDSENAFADSYGAHREALELKLEWLPILRQECVNNGVKFMSTPFDEPSLDALLAIDVDILKVASFDIGNLPFINRVAQSGKPVVISVGGGRDDQIRSSVDLLNSKNVETVVLHCVSEYPCEYSRLGLASIKTLSESFPNCTIGLSDHFNGTLSGPVAYLQGAKVFEKHVTLNRAWKGTDHSFALEPDGFRKLVRDLKRVRHMLPPKSKDDLGNEAVFKKLGKSIAAYRDIAAGEALSLDNITGKIFEEVKIPVRQSSEYIGKIAKRPIKAGDVIQSDDLI